jgi:hypothetical protein
VEIRCRFTRQLALDVEVDVWGLEQ